MLPVTVLGKAQLIGRTDSSSRTSPPSSTDMLEKQIKEDWQQCQQWKERLREGQTAEANLWLRARSITHKLKMNSSGVGKINSFHLLNPTCLVNAQFYSLLADNSKICWSCGIRFYENQNNFQTDTTPQSSWFCFLRFLFCILRFFWAFQKAQLTVVSKNITYLYTFTHRCTDTGIFMDTFVYLVKKNLKWFLLGGKK